MDCTSVGLATTKAWGGTPSTQLLALTHWSGPKWIRSWSRADEQITDIASLLSHTIRSYLPIKMYPLWCNNYSIPMLKCTNHHFLIFVCCEDTNMHTNISYTAMTLQICSFCWNSLFGAVYVCMLSINGYIFVISIKIINFVVPYYVHKYIHTGNTIIIHKYKHMHIHDLRKAHVIS